jgi:hypothetical protein
MSLRFQPDDGSLSIRLALTHVCHSVAHGKRVANQCDAAVFFLLFLKLFFGGFGEGYSVLAEVEAAKFL